MLAAATFLDRPVHQQHCLVAHRQRFGQDRLSILIIDIAVQNRFGQKFIMHKGPF